MTKQIRLAAEVKITIKTITAAVGRMMIGGGLLLRCLCLTLRANQACKGLRGEGSVEHPELN